MNQERDEFKERVLRHESQPLSLEETLEKSSLDEIRAILDKGEEQPIARPVVRFAGDERNYG